LTVFDEPKIKLKVIKVVKRQYFLMPYRFLQESSNSTGFRWNPLELNWNPPESTGMWNWRIPAGMELEFQVF
jgi:hypothetical protein